MISLPIMDLRKQVYQNSLRGDFMRSVQTIHDYVRIGKVKRLSSPLSVFWSITSKCNLRCNHCYASNIINSQSSDISLSQAYYIINELKKMNIWDVVLQGGEPLTYQYILPLISSLKEHDLALTLITNGTLLTPTCANFINKTLDSLDLIQISLDGYDMFNDNIRGNGTYKAVINNLEHLDFKNVVINTVVTRDNIKSLSNMCEDILSKTQIRDIHFSPLMSIGNGIHIQKPDYNDAINTFSKLINTYKEIRFSGTMIPDSLFLKEHNPHNIDLTKVKLGCCAGRSKVFIDNQGEVYSCDFLQNSQHLSIFKYTLRDIWDILWKEQIEQTYSISKIMFTEHRIMQFCPNMK